MTVKLFHRNLTSRPDLAELVRGIKLLLARAHSTDPSDLQSVLQNIPSLYSLVVDVVDGTYSRARLEWIYQLDQTHHIHEITINRSVSLARFAQHSSLKYLAVFGFHGGETADQRFICTQLTSLQITTLWELQSTHVTRSLRHLSISPMIVNDDPIPAVIPSLPNIVSLRVTIDLSGATTFSTIFRVLGTMTLNLRFLWIDFDPFGDYVVPDSKVYRQSAFRGSLIANNSQRQDLRAWFLVPGNI